MQMSTFSQSPDTMPHRMSNPGYTLTRYTRSDDVPMEQAKGLLLDHAELMLGRSVAAGGPWFDVNPHMDGFWAGFDAYLPPNGSYYLAHDTNGRAVGTASMKRISETTGEMKHLYVDPSMRGTGLGYQFVQRRIDDARAMGLKALTADTFKCNPELPQLYKKFGFKEVSSAANSFTIKTSPELEEHMFIYHLDL